MVSGLSSDISLTSIIQVRLLLENSHSCKTQCGGEWWDKFLKSYIYETKEFWIFKLLHLYFPSCKKFSGKCLSALVTVFFLVLTLSYSSNLRKCFVVSWLFIIAYLLSFRKTFLDYKVSTFRTIIYISVLSSLDISNS